MRTPVKKDEEDGIENLMIRVTTPQSMSQVTQANLYHFESKFEHTYMIDDEYFEGFPLQSFN